MQTILEIVHGCVLVFVCVCVCLHLALKQHKKEYRKNYKNWNKTNKVKRWEKPVRYATINHCEYVNYKNKIKRTKTKNTKIKIIYGLKGSSEEIVTIAIKIT